MFIVVDCVVFCFRMELGTILKRLRSQKLRWVMAELGFLRGSYGFPQDVSGCLRKCVMGESVLWNMRMHVEIVR